jgi:hypothetical protein
MRVEAPLRSRIFSAPLLSAKANASAINQRQQSRAAGDDGTA